MRFRCAAGVRVRRRRYEVTRLADSGLSPPRSMPAAHSLRRAFAASRGATQARKDGGVFEARDARQRAAAAISPCFQRFASDQLLSPPAACPSFERYAFDAASHSHAIMSPPAWSPVQRLSLIDMPLLILLMRLFRHYFIIRVIIDEVDISLLIFHYYCHYFAISAFRYFHGFYAADADAAIMLLIIMPILP